MDSKTIARFMAKVDFTNGEVPKHLPHLGPCQPWTAVVGHSGYGRFKIGERSLLAHRVAWCIDTGSDYPESHIVIMHACDNRRCCRPDHLSAGTQSDNLIDRHRKGRDPQHMGKGEKNACAKVTDDLVRYIRANPDGLSMCEISRRIHVSFSLVCRIKRGERWAHVQ